MKRSTEHRTAAILAVTTLGLLCSTPSYAYLDPGTGSIVLQGLLASIAVGIGVLRRYWLQCKTFLARPKDRSHNQDNDGEPEFEQTSNIQTKS